jgi:O-antigen/teichoic acid export membrane protein
LVLLLFSREILAFWISPAFADSYHSMFEVLVLVYATFSMAGPGYQTLFGLGRVRFLAVFGVIGSVGTLIGIAVLAPRFGVLGAAIANAAYISVLATSLAASKAVGLNPLRALVADMGVPLALLYFAVCISLVQPGLPYRAIAGLVLLAALSVNAWRCLVSRGRSRSRDNLQAST